MYILRISFLELAQKTEDSLYTIKLGFIRDHAESIMKSSPINYIRDAKLCRSLFNPKDSNGMVLSVDINFFINYTEPLEALVFVKEDMDWPLGELIDNYELLLILKAKAMLDLGYRAALLRSFTGKSYVVF